MLNLLVNVVVFLAAPPPKQEMVLPIIGAPPTQTSIVQTIKDDTHVTTPIATETSPEVTQAASPASTTHAATPTLIETPPRTPAPVAKQVTVPYGKKPAVLPQGKLENLDFL